MGFLLCYCLVVFWLILPFVGGFFPQLLFVVGLGFMSVILVRNTKPDFYFIFSCARHKQVVSLYFGVGE